MHPRDHNSMEARRPILDERHEEALIPFNGRRNEAAAPPLYLLFLLIVPIGVALFICASRFYDYRHHGFDIISGSCIGALTSWFSFRVYHMPMARGSGWSWGPRSAERAFGVGVGADGYVSSEDMPQREGQDDLELGTLPSQSQRHTDSPYDPSPRPETRGGKLDASNSGEIDPRATLEFPVKALSANA